MRQMSPDTAGGRWGAAGGKDVAAANGLRVL